VIFVDQRSDFALPSDGRGTLVVKKTSPLQRDCGGVGVRRPPAVPQHDSGQLGDVLT